MQVIDGKRLDLDRVLNLEELRAYFSAVAKYLRARELDAIESAVGDKDRESKEKVARPLGRMQVTSPKDHIADPASNRELPELRLARHYFITLAGSLL